MTYQDFAPLPPGGQRGEFVFKVFNNSPPSGKIVGFSFLRLSLLDYPSFVKSIVKTPMATPGAKFSCSQSILLVTSIYSFWFSCFVNIIPHSVILQIKRSPLIHTTRLFCCASISGGRYNIFLKVRYFDI